MAPSPSQCPGYKGVAVSGTCSVSGGGRNADKFWMVSSFGPDLTSAMNTNTDPLAGVNAFAGPWKNATAYGCVFDPVTTEALNSGANIFLVFATCA